MRHTLSLLLLLIAGTVSAQAPALGYVYPPAVKAGSTTEVQLGGYDFTPDMQFFVHDERVKLNVLGGPGEFFVPEPPYWFGPKGRTTAFPIPRELPATIEVPSDAPPGPVRWQVANANGSSAAAVFFVSDGPEIVEDRYRDQPQQLDSLPIAVSGRIRKIAEVDQYRLVAERDGPITIELFARRLGANFNGVIQVRDSNELTVADIADALGLDTALTFQARAGEAYTIDLFDCDFRGNRAFVYRLAITPGPRVVAMMPAAGRRGETAKVTFLGYGLETGRAVLESATRTITFPADPQQQALRYRLETEFGTAPAIEIPLSDWPELSGPLSEGALALQPPCAVTAELHSAEESEYTWEGKQGETYRIRAQSRAIGTYLDLAIRVRDGEGKLLSENDDLPATPDAGLDFTLPADGTYTCAVRDLAGGGRHAEAVYRLSIAPLKPGFSLTAPQQLNIAVGGKAQLAVKAIRQAGFKEEISLRIEGLPAGVSATGDMKIPAGKNELKVPLEAAQDAAATAGIVRVIGTAPIGEATVERIATATAAGNLCVRDPAASQIDKILVSVTLPAPFKLQLIDKNRQRPVHRGTTYPAPFIIHREEGFAGPLSLQMAAQQSRHRQGIRGAVLEVPADADHVLYPSFMPEWLETDRTTRMTVMGVAQVADAQGNTRHVLSRADGNITMILEGALLKLAHRAAELTVQPGSSFDIPIEVSRSAKLPEAARIELESPRELAGLLTCEPITLDVEDQRGVLRVNTTADARLSGAWRLRIKATAMQDGRWPAVSITHVPVVFGE